MTTPPRSPDDTRRLGVYLRTLLPNPVDASAAFEETMLRLPATGGDAENIARQVAAESRKGRPTPFGDDLFRQLADLRAVPLKPESVRELWTQLPPPERELIRRKYELGMTIDEMASSDHRPAAAIAREYHALHASLVSRLIDPRDGTVPPPAGGADLGRLSLQLLDGTISDDGRMVLETLLLADHAAQTHHQRHVALVCELEWRYRPPRTLPEATLAGPRPNRVRDWVVTVSFLVAAAGAIAYLVAFLVDRLGK